MAYNPQLYSPYAPSSMQPPVNGLISVTGLDGAKAYPLPPNSSMPLFDENEDIMYVKRTDGAGFPTVTAYRFEAFDPSPAVLSGDYVTREEFDKLFAMIAALKEDADGKQPVPEAAE